MAACLRALFACLIVWSMAGVPTLAVAQDVDPFALLFDEEDADVDADMDDGAGLDDLNIITLKLRDLILDDGFTAYDTEGGLCLPVDLLMTAFEFPVEVNEDRATGWFIEEGRTLEIDFALETASVSGRSIDLPNAPFLNTDDGWCATTDSLSAMLSIPFTYDERNLRVVADPDEILPIEAKLERQQFREDALKDLVDPEEDYVLADNPYSWMSWPVADVGVDLTTSSSGDISVNFDIEAAGDMLGTSGRIRTVGGSQAGMLDNLRVTLGRTNPEPKELGPLAARQFQLGDISTPNLPLVTRSINGAGVVITNRSSFQADMFDTTEIRGPLPTGWEAELYIGAQLLAFTTQPDSNGDYVFDEVPLRSGYNRFTVKLFGPFGETDEREIKYFVGAELEPENESSYFVGLVNSRKPLVETVGLVSHSGAAETESDAEDEDGLLDAEALGLGDLFDESLAGSEEIESNGNDPGYALVGSATYGLTDKLTVRFDGALGLEEDNRNTKTASLSVASAVAGGFAVGRVASNGSGTPAVEASFQRRLFDQSNMSLRAVSYGDLENEITGRGPGRTVREAQLRALTSLNVSGRSMPVQAQLNYKETADGSLIVEGASRLSTSVRGIRLTKSVQATHIDSGQGSSQFLGGALLFSKRQGKMRIAGGVGYDASNGFDLTSVGISAQRQLPNNALGSLALAHTIDSKDTTLSATWARPFKQVTLSTHGSLSDDGDWSLGARLGFSLGRETGRLRPRLSADGNLTRMSEVRGHVFIDDNLNGVYDEGEAEVENARMLINGIARENRTDANGVIHLDKITTADVQTFSVDLATIDDPFLVPAEESRSFLPRPGQTLHVPVALQPTGDAEGYMKILKGELELAASGIPVQAVDADGKVVAETATDFDGYFYLDRLPLRALTLRVPEEAVEGAAITVDDVPIELTVDEPSYLGAELTVYIG